MSIATVYAEITPWFDRWVRTMELRARRLELQDAALGRTSVLILSPPTDTGVRMIARANDHGETHLLCWSTPLVEAARREVVRHGLSRLRLLSADPPAVPLADDTLDVVFANCVFDFCAPSEIEAMLTEIRRVLRPGGSLLTVYMGHPSGARERLWCTFFERARSLSHGCHPVDLLPALRELGFGDPDERCMRRFGFPIRYVQAMAPGPPPAYAVVRDGPPGA